MGQSMAAIEQGGGGIAVLVVAIAVIAWLYYRKGGS